MSKLEIDWDNAPAWAQWAAQDADGSVWVFERRPIANARSKAWDELSAYGRVDRVSAKSSPPQIWTATLTQRPQTVLIHQDNDGAGTLRAQIGHLLEDMTPEQLDALYAHARKMADEAKFVELNQHLNRPFGEVPRVWQLKAFEAWLDGARFEYRVNVDSADWHDATSPNWLWDLRYRVKLQQA